MRNGYICLFFLLFLLPTAKAQYTQSLHGIGVDGLYPVRDQQGNVYVIINANGSLGGVIYPNVNSNGTGIAKFDPQGNLVWASTQDANSVSLLNPVDVDANGNVLFTMVYADTVRWGGQMVTLHPSLYGLYNGVAVGLINSAGTVQWIHDVDNRQGLTNSATFIQPGKIAFLTSIKGPATFNGHSIPQTDSLIGRCLVLDMNGTVLNDHVLISDDNTAFSHVVAGPSNDLIAIGQIDGDSATWLGTTIQGSSGVYTFQSFITRFDQSGTLDWVSAFDGPLVRCFDLASAPNGDAYFVGQMFVNTLTIGGVTANITPGQGGGMLTGKLNANGSTAWLEALQSPLSNNDLYSINFDDASGRLLVSGRENGNGSFAGYVALLDSSANFISEFLLDSLVAIDQTSFIDSANAFLGGYRIHYNGQSLFNQPFSPSIPNTNGCWWANTGIDYNGLSGNHYADLDNSGSFNTGDFRVSSVPVTTATGLVSFPNSNGDYELNVGPGAYTVMVQPPAPVFSVAPPSYSGSFANLGNTTSGLDFRSVPSQMIPDLQLHLVMGPSTLYGATNPLSLLAGNQGSVAGGGTVTLELPPNTAFVSASPTPDTVQGNHFAWNIASIAPLDDTLISVIYQVLLSALPGDEMSFTAQFNGLVTDFDVNNQSDTADVLVVASLDPNDKQVSPSVATPSSSYAQGSAPLQYQIRFQNTGTAPAYRVVVRDTLPIGLDLSSFRMLGSSHANSVILQNDRVLIWTFDPIVLPDSGADLSGSNGFILFELKTDGGMSLGDSISNRCSIYFDYNAPVLTNSAVFKVENPIVNGAADLKRADAQLYPNPGSEGFSLKGLAQSQFPLKVAVYDIEGKLRLEKEISSDNQLARVSAAQLPAGLFLVRVGTADGEMLSFRWMHR